MDNGINPKDVNELMKLLIRMHKFRKEFHDDIRLIKKTVTRLDEIILKIDCLESRLNSMEQNYVSVFKKASFELEIKKASLERNVKDNTGKIRFIKDRFDILLQHLGLEFLKMDTDKIIIQKTKE